MKNSKEDVNSGDNIVANKDKIKKKKKSLNKNNIKIKENSILKKEKSLRSMLEDIEKDDKVREIVIRRLLDQKVSKDIKEEKINTISGKLSNFLTNVIGNKTFILLLSVFIVIWFIYNIFNFKENKNMLSLINIGISGLMMLSSSLIILGQNQKKKLEEKKSENDYKVNLKNEIVIEDLHYKLDELLRKQEEMSARVSNLEGNSEGEKRKISQKKYKFIDIIEK